MSLASPLRAGRARAFARGAAVVAGGAAGLTAAALVLAPAADAHASAAASPATGKSALVVKVDATRGKYKDVLVTTQGVGLTLYEYTDKKVPCGKTCQAVWPPLYLPKGATVPAGVKGLGTVKTSNGRLQVTYQGNALYTYFDDGGNSTSGVGLPHWVIALEK